MLTLLLALTAPAEAGRHEISYEYAHTAINDVPAGVIGANHPSAFGLRVGGAVLSDPFPIGLTVLGSWSRARESRDHYVIYQDEQDIFHEGGTVGTRSITDRWGVGLKVDREVMGFLFPYVRVEARLVSVAASFNDGVSTEQRHHALAPGGLFTGGVELMLPDRKLDWPLTAGIFIEGGYAVEGDVHLGDAGTINLSGATLRAGLGLRF